MSKRSWTLDHEGQESYNRQNEIGIDFGYQPCGTNSLGPRFGTVFKHSSLLGSNLRQDPLLMVAPETEKIFNF